MSRPLAIGLVPGGQFAAGHRGNPAGMSDRQRKPSACKETSGILGWIRAARVIVWLDHGWLRYRGPARAVERLLPELEAHREDIAAELRWHTRAPVVSGRLRLKP